MFELPECRKIGVQGGWGLPCVYTSSVCIFGMVIIEDGSFIIYDHCIGYKRNCSDVVLWTERQFVDSDHYRFLG